MRCAEEDRKKEVQENEEVGRVTKVYLTYECGCVTDIPASQDFNQSPNKRSLRFTWLLLG